MPKQHDEAEIQLQTYKSRLLLSSSAFVSSSDLLAMHAHTRESLNPDDVFVLGLATHIPTPIR